MELSEVVIKEARAVGKRVSRSSRGLVDADDLAQEALIWAIKNTHRVDEWLEEGKVGRAKLVTALYRACQRTVLRERVSRTGSQHGDHFYYTPDILRTLLPDVYEVEGWSLDAPAPSDGRVSGTRAPNEGNNRLAMLVDVKSALLDMSENDQRLLGWVFRDGHAATRIAVWLEVTDDTVRNRTEAALTRLADRLGGFPPWWAGGRKAKTNAASQSETRSHVA